MNVQTRGFIRDKQLIFSQKIFFTKVSFAGNGTLFLNCWEMIAGNVGEQWEVPVEMKEFYVWDPDKIQ